MVDDDPAVGKVLIAQLAQAGIACRHAPDAAAALVLLGEQPVDVVITDLRMPGASGLELLEEIVKRWPEIPVILLTAHGSVGVAVEAMKKGAADFLLKPFDREEILFTVRKQIAAARHADRPPAAEGNAAAVSPASSEMREVQDLIRRAAGSTRHRPDPRRERDGKGAGGARDSRQQPAAERAVREDSVRRAAGHADRERALRLRERARSPGRPRASRVGSSSPRAGRCSSTRSATSPPSSR